MSSNKLIRSLFVTFTLIVVSVCLSIFALAADASVSVNSETASPGDTVTFKATLSGSIAVGSGSVAVSYDPDVLELVDGSCNVSGAPLTNFDKSKGKGAFAFFGGTTTVSGDLFTAIFKVKDSASAGTYDVSMDVVLRDGSGADLPLTNNSGSITVAPAEPEIPSVGETVTGYSLTLQGGGNGDIGINLFFKADQALRIDTGAYLNVFKNGETEKVYVSEFIFDAHDKTKYTTYVSAKNMSDDITVTFYNGEGESGASYTYSVKSYAEYILENAAMQTTNLINLVKSLLNYGAAAQEYFDYTEAPLANENMSENDKGAVSACTEIGNAADRTVAASGNSADVGVSAHTATLLLGSKTTIRHYVTLAEGVDVASLSFTVGGKALTPVKSGARYIVDITDIPATMLDDGYALTVTGSNGSYSVTYSALNYLSRMYDSSKDEAAMADYTNLLKAMYLYNQAADLYFN